MKAFQLPTFETERLHLRQLTENDLDLIYRLNSNAEVMKYITGYAEDFEASKAALKRYLFFPEKANAPVGMWITSEKSTGKEIGWHIFKKLDETGEFEIGYRLLPEFWGKGYATEGAKRLMKYGIEDLKAPSIVAVTLPKNDASGHILMKLGLKFIEIGTFYSKITKYYKWNNEEME